MENNQIPLSLQQRQAVLMDILLAFAQYCAAHELPFYLCGGTLLGALRHGGFIPWDDDVDVFMARPDYERLIVLAQTEPVRDDLRFACPQNGRFFRAFTRLYMTSTTVQRDEYKSASMPHLWIDIEPVDGLPEDLGTVRRIYTKRKCLNFLNSVSMWRFGKADSLQHLLMRLLAYPIARPFGPHFWAMRLEKLAMRYPFETSDYVGCVAMGKYGTGERMPKDAFLQSADVEFEGYTFKTMSCWEMYLSGIYGDWRTPPEVPCAPHPNHATMDADAFERIREKYPNILKRG